MSRFVSGSKGNKLGWRKKSRPISMERTRSPECRQASPRVVDLNPVDEIWEQSWAMARAAYP
jgi:hypothetical protein